ncbi:MULTISPECIES: flagellar hook-basal body protein [unclassified Virgibacillus]|uniref:flagellar hook-basal body protein n=1 Tax=unclassified Virgibacillus TaxID=2620237 RepID=UPI00090B199C|nr:MULTISPECIES: flagellar hook-basal body protein [unclassified Virgibacillus]API91801.1 flagellar biosynthesis protein FlgC [Virgibacillus sp. 6R]MBS7427927.1 flagellar hook-basal body protein [Virgibacillus sp. 19R1-5]
MLRGFYTAANGMIAQQRQQEAFANNISNANTPGYKADQTTLRAFPEMLMNQMAGKELPIQNKTNVPIQQPIGSLNTGVYVQEMIPNFNQGDIQETGIPTDFALVQRNLPDETGALFFTVQNEAGDVRYTRNGNFTVDGAGFLVTNEGYYVLDVNGEPIATNDKDFTVTNDGLLQTANGAIPLGFAYAADANTMVKEGNDLYTGDVEAVPADATFSVKQGFLERSNVDTLQAMTQMMESYRLFETNQRVLKAYDQSMEKAVSEIGRLV